MSASLLPDPVSSVAREPAEPAPTSEVPVVAQERRLRVWLDRFECGAVLLLALLAIALHLRFVSHVGGLWRDEANSANLATLPSLGEIWHLLDYDSFPILFFAVLRTWSGVFGPNNDAALRALGCIMGLGVLWALWFNGRKFGVRWPVLSLALIGLNPMVIRYGDSTRAYGLGMLLIVLTFCSFWRLVNTESPPSRRRVVVATVLALLSVQCVYYNATLLLAIVAGTAAVALRARAWRTIGIVLAIGILAATSYLPYLPMMRRMQAWNSLVSFPADLPWLWKRVCEVIGSPDPRGIWLWLGLFFAGFGVVAGVAVSHLRHRFARGNGASVFPNTPPAPARQPLPDAVLFAAVALGVGVVAYAGFLRSLHYFTQPWYYILLVTFAACALEIVFGSRIGAPKLHVSLLLRSVRLVVAFALILATVLPAWKELPTRHTNLDLVATQLRSRAAKGDLILAPQWACAIPLCRYYGGPAEIVTIPPIADHRVHRYDLVLQQMTTANPVQPVLSAVEEVLRSGHHVFIMGRLPFPDANFSIPIPPVDYRDPKVGYFGAAYYWAWQLRVGQFIRAHAVRRGRIEVPVPGKIPVQEFENLELALFDGWR